MKRFSIPLGVALAVLSLLAAGTPAHAGERPFRVHGSESRCPRCNNHASPFATGVSKLGNRRQRNIISKTFPEVAVDVRKRPKWRHFLGIPSLLPRLPN